MPGTVPSTGHVWDYSISSKAPDIDMVIEMRRNGDSGQHRAMWENCDFIKSCRFSLIMISSQRETTDTNDSLFKDTGAKTNKKYLL